jgi:hypothetical protein
MNEQLKALAQVIREELAAIPPALKQDEVVRQTIIMMLAQAVKQMGLVPVPAWKPPRSTRDRLDLVGVKPGTHPPEIQVAFAVDALVDLPRVKAMDWVDCPDKVFVTFSERLDKIKPTTLFLGPAHTHLNLYEA